jgi:hypothetical protein
MVFHFVGSDQYALVKAINGIFPQGANIRARALFKKQRYVSIDCDELSEFALSAIQPWVKHPSTPPEVREMNDEHGLLWVPAEWIIEGVKA